MAVENSRSLSMEYPEVRVLIDPGKEKSTGSSEGSGLIHRLEKGRCRRKEWRVLIDPGKEKSTGSSEGSGLIHRLEKGRCRRKEWRVLIDPGKEKSTGSSEGSGLIHRLEKGRCRRKEWRVLIDPGKEMCIGSSEGSGLIHRLEKGRCRREEWGVSTDPGVDMCIGSFGGSGTINRVEFGRNSRIECDSKLDFFLQLLERKGIDVMQHYYPAPSFWNQKGVEFEGGKYRNVMKCLYKTLQNRTSNRNFPLLDCVVEEDKNIANTLYKSKTRPGNILVLWKTSLDNIWLQL
ncbi:hypothetical protein QAD02_000896 [Eretmocerus hayati]|uniref:Uncharacterized protein n=1 Tax=Eretmocerus hayati TaxID=131215 RepID=A0ACC2NEW1_9HYME|nr:hypothetical protein QAD02_000896 [Eretmocerus hayati]